MKKGWRIFFYLEVLVHFGSLRVRLWKATGTQKKDSFSTIIFHGPYLKSKRSSLHWFKQVFDSNDSVSRHPSITNHQTLKFLQTKNPNKKLTTRFFFFLGPPNPSSNLRFGRQSRCRLCPDLIEAESTLRSKTRRIFGALVWTPFLGFHMKGADNSTDIYSQYKHTKNGFATRKVGWVYHQKEFWLSVADQKSAIQTLAKSKLRTGTSDSQLPHIEEPALSYKT